MPETGDLEVPVEIVDIWCEGGGFVVVAADDAGGEELIRLETLLTWYRGEGQGDGDYCGW